MGSTYLQQILTKLRERAEARPRSTLMLLRHYARRLTRIQKNFVFAFGDDLKAFLRFDAGVGWRVPPDPQEQIQRLRQRLQQEKQQSRKKQQRLQQPDAATNDWFQIFRDLVSPYKPGKMLDLGAGHGIYSLVAAELGWEVTAVDARTRRMPDPETEKDPYRAQLIRSVRWVQADVREVPIRKGEYDLICILGLLHHLEVEDQMKLLRRCSDTLTLLKTRTAQKKTTIEGAYEGRYYHKWVGPQGEREQINWWSWGNEASFRHTEESLVRLARDCGYSRVWCMIPPTERNYTFYLCLPSP